MVHNRWFHVVGLVASISLLALALIEHPAVTNVQWPVWIHTILELICLFMICLELGIKIQWLGLKQYVKHRRTMAKSVVLLVMFVEACVVLVRQTSHFRITRSLRPIFLIDSFYSYNVRRFVRQIFLSLTAVLDMLLILLIFMFIFSILDLRDMYLSFKSLNTTHSNCISKEQFNAIYQVSGYAWRRQKTKGSWLYERYPACCRYTFSGLAWLVKGRPFRYFFFGLEFLCGVWYCGETFLAEYDTHISQYFVASEFFVIAFMLEVALKLLGLGPWDFFSSGWNIFDLLVSLGSVVGLGLTVLHEGFAYLVLLRFLSIFQLLQAKKSYRNIFNTVTILIPRFVSAAVVLFLVYYFFAIVGMELFSKHTEDLKNCCPNASQVVLKNYVYNPNTTTYGYYYLNSFQNILISGVTLWDLMVVNNWFIIMEGFTAVTHNVATRLFFMLYFIVMMVLLSIVVSFILEGFVFRIQCSRAQNDGETDNGYVKIEISVKKLEMDLLCAKGETITESELVYATEAAAQEDEIICYEGIRWKDRFDFSEELYASQLQGWETRFLGAERVVNEGNAALEGYNRLREESAIADMLSD